MYDRDINGSTHTFGVSGKLIMNALVMYDHQTDTLWSQFLRRGVKGPLEGVELEVVPVTQTTWAGWRELHPDTLVLDKKGAYGGDSYAAYYRDGRAGVIGESNRDDRLNSKQLVIGIDLGGATRAYPLALLQDQQVLNDSLEDRNVLVFFDPATGTALAYDSTVDGNTLEFTLEEGAGGTRTTLIDDRTGSRWLAFTGRAIEGEMRGRSLDRLLSHLSFWFAWSDWNPDTSLYTG